MPAIDGEEGRGQPVPRMQRFDLAPGYSISRVIKGGWQLAGGHGQIERDGTDAVEDMRLYAEAGITTFDCADIYTGVEELIGEFLQRYEGAMRNGSLPGVQVHTKCVPDLDDLPGLQRRDIEAIVDRSLRRLGLDRLDLVQFHWWDYSIPGYVEALSHLKDLRRAGKIREIGVTNFDTPRLEEVLDAGIPVVSNQVQYSALDHRPEGDMASMCQRRGITLLAYGTVAGGLLSDRYLGAPEPGEPYENRSLVKYKLIVDEFGGWELFQRLLGTLEDIAQRHRTSIAVVAGRYILQKAGVGAAIIGARHARHLPDALRLFDFSLDEEDLDAIASVVADSLGPRGDVYSLERIKDGKHAGIMKYNLNRP